MKDIVIKSFLVILILLVIPWSALSQAVKKGPRLVLQEKVFDFGTVSEGEVIEHAFKVLNDGDQDLKIIRVKPG